MQHAWHTDLLLAEGHPDGYGRAEFDGAAGTRIKTGDRTGIDGIGVFVLHIDRADAGLIELLNHRILRLSDQIVGNLGHAGRNIQRDDRALGLLGIRRRIRAHHLVFFDGAAIDCLDAAHLEAGGFQNGLGLFLTLVRHIGH